MVDPRIEVELAAAIALVQLGRLGVSLPRIKEVDINPMIVSDSAAVAVDARFILG